MDVSSALEGLKALRTLQIEDDVECSDDVLRQLGIDLGASTQEAAEDAELALGRLEGGKVTFEAVRWPEAQLLVECDRRLSSHIASSFEYSIKRVLYRMKGNKDIELRGDEKREAEKHARLMVPELGA